jgi:lipid A 4'-phosphatase
VSARRIGATYAAALGAASALFLLFPGIDLWAERLFYAPGGGFFLADWWPVRAIYVSVPYLTDAVVVGVAAAYLIALLRQRPVWRIDGRVAAFLLLSLALGPGLLVNTALKDHWGRARPIQIAAFGGSRHFTPAPLPAQECERNCSFPAGHPAMGFYLISFALLIEARRRRQLAIVGALALGGGVGLARMAQGGHFLSDVVFSGLLVALSSTLLYRALVANERLRAQLPQWRPPPRLAAAGLALLMLILLSIAFLDRPLAWFFHASDPQLRAVFGVITQFGLSKGYLLLAALLFIGFWLAALAARGTARGAALALNAWRALFVFAALASAGLFTDLVKMIFGRLRPKLLFNDGLYGFTWGSVEPDHWSFPSGHATTIVALAVALFLLWPRGALLYAIAAMLVAASRIIVGAHYLSDVLMGGAVGAAVTLLVWQAFARAGVGLGGARLPQPLPASAPSLER